MRHLSWIKKISLLVLCLGLLLVPMVAAGQADERFEVASIRPDKDAGRGASIKTAPGGGRFIAADIALRNLITLAYHVKDENLVNMPKLTGSAYYTIEAKQPERSNAAAYSMEQEMPMLRHLLEDRFQLRTHWEQRQRAGMALMLVNGKDTLQQPDKNGKCPRDGGVLTIELLRASLERILDQPVTNQTGLSGAYCIGLRWQSDDGTPQSLATASGRTSEKSDENSDMSLYTALRKQLGLMVKPQRTAVSILVVDFVQPPSPN